MIVVDSSVWIDFLRNQPTRQVAVLEQSIDEDVLMPDLVLCEVLQGVRDTMQFERWRKRLALLEPLAITSHELAIQAARNYRLLRKRGITVRKTIDTLIATRCILDRLPLLYSDRDFDPFVEHLGLRSALDLPGVN